MRTGMWLLAAALCAGQAVAAQRVALVVGNVAYAENPLRNCVNDARSIGAALRALGFDVKEITDASRDQMDDGLSWLERSLGGAELGLFYYSGHGMQVDGQNYLIPIGTELGSEGQVRRRALSADEVVATFAKAGTRTSIVILDACRDNPFVARATRGGTRGLAPMIAFKGSLIAFAADAGQTASDNPDGANGLYTEELLKNLRTPGLSVEQVFKRTRVGVVQRSREQQVPAEYSKLTEELVLVPPGVVAAPEPSAPAPRSEGEDPLDPGIGAYFAEDLAFYTLYAQRPGRPTLVAANRERSRDPMWRMVDAVELEAIGRGLVKKHLFEVAPWTVACGGRIPARKQGSLLVASSRSEKVRRILDLFLAQVGRPGSAFPKASKEEVALGGGATGTRVRGLPFEVVLHDDGTHLLFASGPQPISDALARRAAGAPSFRTTPLYRKLLAQVPESADGYTMVPMATWARFTAEDKLPVAPFLAAMEGFVVGGSYHPPRTELRGAILLDVAHEGAKLVEALAGAGGLGSLAQIDAGVHLYLAVRRPDDLLASLPAGPARDTLEVQLSQLKGALLAGAGLAYAADVEPWLGHELASAVRLDGKHQQVLGAALLESVNHDAVPRAIAKVIAHFGAHGVVAGTTTAAGTELRELDLNAPKRGFPTKVKPVLGRMLDYALVGISKAGAAGVLTGLNDPPPETNLATKVGGVDADRLAAAAYLDLAFLEELGPDTFKDKKTGKPDPAQFAAFKKVHQRLRWIFLGIDASSLPVLRLVLHAGTP